MECVIKKRKPRIGRKRHRGAVLAALAAGLVIALSAAVNGALSRHIAAAAEAKTFEAVSKGLTGAAAQAVAGEDSSKLLTLTQTGESTYAIMADSAALNAIACRVTALAQDAVAGMGSNGVGVELGTVSGVACLAGRGPQMRARFTPMGGVTGRITSSLKSAGVNQSLFTVSLELTCAVRLLTPGHDKTVTVKTDVPLAQTVVVGAVPQVYTNVANEDDMLNLIPTDLP